MLKTEAKENLKSQVRSLNSSEVLHFDKDQMRKVVVAIPKASLVGLCKG